MAAPCPRSENSRAPSARSWRSGNVLLLLAAVLLAALLLWRVPATARQVDASQDRRAIAYAQAALMAAPPGAIVVTSSDRDTFALWYYHDALGMRPDLIVVAEPLLVFGWYQEHIRVLYPTLRLPLPASHCRTDPDGMRPLDCVSFEF